MLYNRSFPDFLIEFPGDQIKGIPDSQDSLRLERNRMTRAEDSEFSCQVHLFSPRPRFTLQLQYIATNSSGKVVAKSDDSVRLPMFPGLLFLQESSSVFDH
jgi:hypothetical protein